MVATFAKTKNLGTVKHGLSHWMMQRLTALALIPLGIWFVYVFSFFATTNDYTSIVIWFGSTSNVVLMILFIVSLYYHAALGLQVIIEDYIHTEWQRISCVVLIKFLMCVLAVTAFVSLLKLYLNPVISL